VKIHRSSTRAVDFNFIQLVAFCINLHKLYSDYETKLSIECQPTLKFIV